MTANPVVAALFLVPAMSLAGVPPFSGFWAKLLVIDASFRHGEMWLAAVALFVGLMTLFSMSKIWIEAFWRPSAGRTVTRRVPIPMLAESGLLAAVTLGISVWPEPFIAYANQAGQALTDPREYIAAVLQPGGTGAR